MNELEAMASPASGIIRPVPAALPHNPSSTQAAAALQPQQQRRQR